MEAPPRKRGRPPKHPKVANNGSGTPSPSPVTKSRANSVGASTEGVVGSNKIVSDGVDIEMVDRTAQPSRTGQRGRKKSMVEKVDGPSAIKPGGGSSSERDSKSEADDDDLPVEKLSTRRGKKSSMVQFAFTLAFFLLCSAILLSIFDYYIIRIRQKI